MHDRQRAFRILTPKALIQSVHVVADFKIFIRRRPPDERIALLLEIDKAAANGHCITERRRIEKQITIGAEIAGTGSCPQPESERKIATFLGCPGETAPEHLPPREAWSGRCAPAWSRSRRKTPRDATLARPQMPRPGRASPPRSGPVRRSYRPSDAIPAV